MVEKDEILNNIKSWKYTYNSYEIYTKELKENTVIYYNCWSVENVFPHSEVIIIKLSSIQFKNTVASMMLE